MTTRSRSSIAQTIAFALIIGAIVVYLRSRDDSCAIHWRVGSVDPRFNISAAEVRRAAETAVGVWESAAGRPLFQYDSIDGIPIELRYDDRQAAVDADRAQRQSIGDLAARITSLQRNYHSNPDEFSAHRLNEAIGTYNQLVAQYNAKPPQLIVQGSFEQVVDRRGRRILGKPRAIAIYQFLNPDDLSLVVAHEFGHGLGLDHINEAAAIMNETHDANDLVTPLKAHNSEAAALREACPRNSR